MYAENWKNIAARQGVMVINCIMQQTNRTLSEGISFLQFLLVTLIHQLIRIRWREFVLIIRWWLRAEQEKDDFLLRTTSCQ